MLYCADLGDIMDSFCVVVVVENEYTTINNMIQKATKRLTVRDMKGEPMDAA